jgi:predicted hotdog family 3-hydroxylacyl-ACP dehydratase
MILLDDILDWQDDTVWCRVCLRQDSMFVRRGSVGAVVAMEYMAQAVGVCTALRALDRQEPLQRGYLVGMRELHLARESLTVGQVLEVKATLTYDGDSLGVFTGEVSCEGETVAQGTLSVYRQDKNDKEGQ